MTFVTLENGHQIFTRQCGRGSAVVLLAGWGMDSRVWGDTMVELSDAGFHALAYDRRGHGRSTDPGPIDYDVLADDLHQFLTATRVTSATLVAHSGASGEAIRYLSRYGSARIRHLVLLGATGPRMIATEGGPGLTREMANEAIARIRNDLPGWLEENRTPFAPQATDRVLDWLATMIIDTPKRLLVDFQRVILETDLIAEARALNVPVTIIHGDQDVSAPLELTGSVYAEVVPNAELIVYRGVAHGIMVTHATRLASDIAACTQRSA